MSFLRTRIYVSSFLEVEPPKRTRKAGDVKSGTKTLRFQSNGEATIEEVDDTMVKVIERINRLLETYMGIDDADLGKFKLQLNIYEHKYYSISKYKNQVYIRVESFLLFKKYM